MKITELIKLIESKTGKKVLLEENENNIIDKLSEMILNLKEFDFNIVKKEDKNQIVFNVSQYFDYFYFKKTFIINKKKQNIKQYGISKEFNYNEVESFFKKDYLKQLIKDVNILDLCYKEIIKYIKIKIENGGRNEDTSEFNIKFGLNPYETKFSIIRSGVYIGSVEINDGKINIKGRKNKEDNYQNFKSVKDFINFQNGGEKLPLAPQINTLIKATASLFNPGNIKDSWESNVMSLVGAGNTHDFMAIQDELDKRVKKSLLGSNLTDEIKKIQCYQINRFTGKVDLSTNKNIGITYLAYKKENNGI